MALSIGELFVSLGFDVDDTKLKSFSDQIVSVRNELFRVSAAAVGAIAAVGEFISGPIERASQFKQFSDQTGYSSEALQKWARVISTVNNTVTFDQAIGKYRAFSDYVQRTNLGQAGNALSSLGADVRPGTSPEEYLEQLSRAAQDGTWQKLGEGWRAQVAQALQQTGLGPDILDALQTSPAQRAAMSAGLTQSQEQTRQLDEMNTKVRELGRQYEALGLKFATTYGDQILKILTQINDEIPKIIAEADKFADTLGGWKDIAQGVLIFFAGQWAAGMIASIGRVGAALIAYSAAEGTGAVLGGGAALGGGLLRGVAGAAAGVGSLALGFEAGKLLMEKTGAGQRIADYVAPINQNVSITVHTSGDAHDIGSAVRRVFDDEMSRQTLKAHSQINLGAQR